MAQTSLSMAGQIYEMWVGGAEMPCEGELIPVEDPSTQEIFAYCRDCSVEGVDGAVKAAHRAYMSGIWSRAPRNFRADVLDKIAVSLQAEIIPLIALEVKQTGRAIREMNAQVPSLVKWFKYYASLLRVEERPVLPTAGKLHNWVDRVPVGVVAQITPFNHPLLIATKKIAPALAAGNSVVLKPSELTPVTSILLGKLFKEAGLPDGVFNVVTGYGMTTGKALVEHPLVKLVDVTGSTKAGKAIGAIAGQKLNTFTAELGGKAPVIVFESSHIDLVINGVAFGSFIASGQTCIAATRILVQNSIMAQFLAKIRTKCDSIAKRMGRPANVKCSMGPLVSSNQLDNVVRSVDDAVAQGASVICGGTRMTGKAEIDSQNLDTGILDTRLWKEEVFGPVIVVVGFANEEEAVTLANDSEFGLGAGLWTNELSQAFRVAERINAGITWVNTHHRNDPSSPWGGMGSSGVGSENGIDAYHSYTKMKSTIINYAATEESLSTDDWFGEENENVRYN